MKKNLIFALGVLSFSLFPVVGAAEPSPDHVKKTASLPTLNKDSTANKTLAANSSAKSAENPSTEKPAIEIITRPEIVGLWGMEIPNNKSCVEFYNFRSASDVVINSGKEWSYAQYEYQPTLDPKQSLAALVMQIRFDNNQVDCSGHQQDQTGEVAQYFVRWKDQNNIQFCANQKGEQCVANLRRILP